MVVSLLGYAGVIMTQYKITEVITGPASPELHCLHSVLGKPWGGLVIPEMPHLGVVKEASWSDNGATSGGSFQWSVSILNPSQITKAQLRGKLISTACILFFQSLLRADNHGWASKHRSTGKLTALDYFDAQGSLHYNWSVQHIQSVCLSVACSTLSSLANKTPRYLNLHLEQ